MFGSIVRVRQAPGANVLLGTLALCAVIFAVSPDGVSAQTPGARNAPILAAVKPPEFQAKALEGSRPRVRRQNWPER
jgi:hypothetical protein